MKGSHLNMGTLYIHLPSVPVNPPQYLLPHFLDHNDYTYGYGQTSKRTTEHLPFQTRPRRRISTNNAFRCLTCQNCWQDQVWFYFVMHMLRLVPFEQRRGKLRTKTNAHIIWCRLLTATTIRLIFDLLLILRGSSVHHHRLGTPPHPRYII